MKKKSTKNGKGMISCLRFQEEREEEFFLDEATKLRIGKGWKYEEEEKWNEWGPINERDELLKQKMRKIMRRPMMKTLLRIGIVTIVQVRMIGWPKRGSDKKVTTHWLRVVHFVAVLISYWNAEIVWIDIIFYIIILECYWCFLIQSSDCHPHQIHHHNCQLLASLRNQGVSTPDRLTKPALVIVAQVKLLLILPGLHPW